LEAQVVDSGTAGGCSWVLTGESGNYTLSVSGEEAKGGYGGGLSGTWQYEVRRLVIEPGMRRIGDYAFGMFTGLVSATIPPSVEEIGALAFAGCGSLRSLVIPSGVSVIGKAAFAGCAGLRSVEIPPSVVEIGAWAFESCLRLGAVVIPPEVAVVRDSTFAYDYSLKSVVIGQGVKALGVGVFAGCTALTTVMNLSATPQAITEADGVFAEVDVSQVTLRVLAEAAEAYRQAPVWQEFGRIEAMEVKER
jgi:hypothetical protein